MIEPAHQGLANELAPGYRPLGFGGLRIDKLNPMAGLTLSRRLGWVVGSIVLASMLGVSAWAALAPVQSVSNEQLYVIPKGTWARRHAGENLDVIPAEIRLTLGVKDVLVMRNDDDVPQLFGPVLIMPGQSFELPFHRPSTYLFTCPLHTSGLLTVNVVPLPRPGWERFMWRAVALVKPGALL